MGLPKRKPYEYPNHSKAEGQESLRRAKIETEHLSEKLRKSIIDNPKMAQKTALLITLWLNGKTKSTKSKG